MTNAYEPADRFATVDGRTLHYRETGPPTGLPVVALHGHPGSAETWDEVATGVCASDGGAYRFLALTQRGYGRSGWGGPYSLPVYAADVLGFVDALGLDAFVLVGHSMGGSVASLAAARSATTGPTGLAGRTGPTGLAGLAGLVLEDSVIPRAGVQLPPPTRPENADALPYDWELVPRIFAELCDPDPEWWTSLARISVPTLILAGGPSSHVPQDVLADTAELIPQARLVKLDVGHSVHRDAPGRFISELSMFLRKIRPAAG